MDVFYTISYCNDLFNATQSRKLPSLNKLTDIQYFLLLLNAFRVLLGSDLFCYRLTDSRVSEGLKLFHEMQSIGLT
jgi:hypothetical protein